MQKVVFVLVLFSLTGCHFNPYAEHDHPHKEKTHEETVKTEKVSKVSVAGKVCGGNSGAKCASGLECKYNEKNPETGGICMETVVEKDLKCPQKQVLVCGLKDRQKNGYLNKCEAKRHGAKIVSEGLCKPEASISGECEARVLGIGNCEAFFSGFEFGEKECKERKVVGCEAEIPFEILEDCQKKCE